MSVDLSQKVRYFLLFVLTCALLFMAVQTAREHLEPAPAEIPDGWKIIRPPHDVMALAVQDDTLWAGGKDGVAGLDRKSGQVVFDLQTQPPLGYVRALLVDRTGNLWIGHAAGLTCYNGSTLHTYSTDDGLPDLRVNALMQDHQGRIWAGTWGGASVLENGVWRTFNQKDGLADNMVNVMLEDRDGGLWFGSYVAPAGGLSYYHEGRWQLFTIQQGLPHNNINAIIQDRDGSIWVGTGLYERGGAVKLVREDTQWSVKQVMTEKDGLAGNKVRSLFQDSDGVIWFGSEYNGAAGFDKGKWLVLTEKSGLSNPEIKSMVEDEKGNLWIGTRDGISRLNRTAREQLQWDANKVLQTGTYK